MRSDNSTLAAWIRWPPSYTARLHQMPDRNFHHALGRYRQVRVFALALRVGMQRVWLDLGTVLHQSIQDVNRLPDAAGDEAGEQGDVAVGDVVVGDAAIAAVADVMGADRLFSRSLTCVPSAIAA